ncbi:MAG: ABC transporter substrate-binding protein [Candidatus Binatia bacterium]
MLSKRDKKVLTRTMSIVVGTLLLGVAIAPQVTHAAALTELVAKANQEGALTVTVSSSISGKLIQQLTAAFKKRFGLDIEVTLTPVSDRKSYSKALAEAKIGTVPTYDAIEGPDTNNTGLVGAGGIQKIDNWETLLAEINPQVRSGKIRVEQLSPGPLKGYGFAYISRVKALLYNPKLISKDKLPKTHAELTDPKYKDIWTQPPWTSHWNIGPMVFPEIGKKKWVDIVRKAGKNAGAVQSEIAGVQRMLLGEYKFTMANSYYYFLFKSKNPKAPLDVTYFEDYNPVQTSFYVVRKAARHPAAATLFAMWMGTPEAESIWQPVVFYTQLWGTSDIDRKVRQLREQSGAKYVDYLSTKQGLDFLRWFRTEEGRKYKQALSRAIRGE